MPSQGQNEGVRMLGELVCDISAGTEELVEHPSSKGETLPTVKSLGLDKLPRDVRLALVQELWDSIAAEGSLPMSDALREELVKRAAEEDTHPEDGIPWEVVKANARKKFLQ